MVANGYWWLPVVVNCCKFLLMVVTGCKLLLMLVNGCEWLLLVAIVKSYKPRDNIAWCTKGHTSEAISRFREKLPKPATFTLELGVMPMLVLLVALLMLMMLMMRNITMTMMD